MITKKQNKELYRILLMAQDDCLEANDRITRAKAYSELHMIMRVLDVLGLTKEFEERG